MAKNWNYRTILHIFVRKLFYAEEKWTIVLSGISIAMGEDVTVTLTSVTANKELSGKVELGGKLGSAFNKDLSNITFSEEV